MLSSEILGCFAASCTMLSFIPQAIKTVRTEQTGALSLLMLCLQTFGCFLWVMYGIWIRSPSVIISDTVTFSVVGSVLLIKIILEKRQALANSATADSLSSMRRNISPASVK
jgi:MtN3 and saliva related transmembrane protein